MALSTVDFVLPAWDADTTGATEWVNASQVTDADTEFSEVWLALRTPRNDSVYEYEIAFVEDTSSTDIKGFELRVHSIGDIAIFSVPANTYLMLRRSEGFRDHPDAITVRVFRVP